MGKKTKILGADLYKNGDLVQSSEDGSIKLSLSKNQQFLFVKAGNGYKLMPVLADVKKLYIEPTTKCNFSCITCIRNSWEEEYENMEWGTFERIIKNIKELPNLEAVFLGGFGEPMMHPRIFDMIEVLKDLKLKVEMITNGSFLNEKVINQLIDLKLDGIFVSFDSPDEKEYNEIRPGGDFNDVFQNVHNLQRIKLLRKSKLPELGIEFVAMKKNFARLPKLIRMAWDLNAGQVIVSNLLPYHESMKDEIAYDLDDTGCMFGLESLLFAVRANVSSMKLRTERYCKFVKDKTMCINYNGDVSPCYALMHAYNCYVYGRERQMHPCYLGNVNNQTLKEIWQDSGYMNFRETVEDFKFPSCTDCKGLDGCNYTEDNSMDCWGNSPSCAECLWARRIIACP
mgnify:CR=1 FL=1